MAAIARVEKTGGTWFRVTSGGRGKTGVGERDPEVRMLFPYRSLHHDAGSLALEIAADRPGFK